MLTLSIVGKLFCLVLLTGTFLNNFTAASSPPSSSSSSQWRVTSRLMKQNLATTNNSTSTPTSAGKLTSSLLLLAANGSSDNTDLSCNDVIGRFDERTTTPANACALVLASEDCQDTDAYFNYVNFLYCALPGVHRLWTVIGGILLVLFMLFLFIIIGVAADDFFCPSLEILSELLHMSQNIAGVTFLAFGNGAPDVFSSIAGVSVALTAEPTLSIGALLGSGLFVSSVVAGSVFLLSAEPLQMPQRPFLRDMIFYICSVVWVLFILWRGSITQLESIFFLVAYVLYALVVILSRVVRMRWMRHGRAHGDINPAVTEERVVEEEVKEEKERLAVQEIMRPTHIRLSSFRYAHQHHHHRHSHSALQVTRSLGGRTNSEPHQDGIGNGQQSTNESFGPSLALPNTDQRRTSLPNNNNFHQQQQPPIPVPPTSRRLVPALLEVPSMVEKSSSATVVVADDDCIDVEKIQVPTITIDNNLNNTLRRRQSVASGSSRDNNSIVIRGTAKDFEKNNAQVAAATNTTSNLLEDDKKSKSSISSSDDGPMTSWWLDVLEHIWPMNMEYWRSLRWYSRIWALIRTPVQVVLLITTPLVDPGEPNMQGWCKWLQVLQVAISPTLCVMATSGVNDRMFFGILPLWTIFAIVSIICAVLLAVFTHRDRVPRNHRLFALPGFIVAVVWIYKTADEIVGILTAMGIIFHISPALLGLSLLAWGNSVPDYVANAAIARQGFANVSISASYAGPLFNILVGMGLSFAIATAQLPGKIIFFHADAVSLLLCFSVLGIQVLTFVGIPLMKFRVPRWFGYFLLGLYVVLLTLIILTETKTIPLSFPNH